MLGNKEKCPHPYVIFQIYSHHIHNSVTVLIVFLYQFSSKPVDLETQRINMQETKEHE